MPKKIKFIKNCDAGFIGEIKNYGNKSADSLVDQDYAEYFEEDKPKEKINKKLTVPNTRLFASFLQAIKEHHNYDIMTASEIDHLEDALNKIELRDDAIKIYIKEFYSKGDQKKINDLAAKIIKSKNKKDLEAKEKVDKERDDKIKLNLESAQGLNLFMENKEQIAEKFYEQNPFFYDRIGFFWFWNKTIKCYERNDELDLMLKLKGLSDQLYFQVTSQKFWTETIRSLKLIGRKYQPKDWDVNCIQFKDRVYDIKKKVSYDPSPDFFNTNPIPHSLLIGGETPYIDSLIIAWVGEEYLLTVKEAIGLCLIQNYPLHRIICLFGSGLNGKSCFNDMLNRFLGKRNICSSDLNKIIKNNFEISKLYKKLCCIMGETNFGEIKDTSILKQLSGHDLLSAEFKGKDSFDYYNNATLFIASNSLPISLDVTDGFFRRWMIIDFKNKFKEGPDPIKGIPPEEYSALAYQLIDILPVLLDRGLFDKDGDIDFRRKKYEEKSSPIKKFIEENYVNDVNGQVPFFEFYDGFVGFCKQRGFRELTKNTVTKILNEHFGVEKERKDVKVNGEWKKWQFLIGLRDKKVTTLSTLSSLDSSPKDIESSGVESGVESVESVEEIVIREDTVFHNCVTCGVNRGCTFASDGKPVCSDCKVSLDTNK